MNKVLKWVLIGLGIALVAFMIAIMVFTRFGDGGQFAGRLGGFPHRYGGMMFGMGFMMLFRLLIRLGWSHSCAIIKPSHCLQHLFYQLNP
jgi:ABC-type Fe3+ transport system permease subunit